VSAALLALHPHPLSALALGTCAGASRDLVAREAPCGTARSRHAEHDTTVWRPAGSPTTRIGPERLACGSSAGSGTPEGDPFDEPLVVADETNRRSKLRTDCRSEERTPETKQSNAPGDDPAATEIVDEPGTPMVTSRWRTPPRRRLPLVDPETNPATARTRSPVTEVTRGGGDPEPRHTGYAE
jgi:hypothetical protein